MYKQILGAIIVAVLSAGGVFGAQIANGGFESDSNAPVLWQADGLNPQIRQSYEAYDRDILIVTLEPFEGQNFVLLQSGGGTVATGYGELTQKITVAVGQSITGAYFFDASDYLPYDDNSTIMLIPDPCSNLSEILLASKSVSDVNSYGTMSDWETFSHTFTELEAGSYTLVLVVQDSIDVVYPSYLAVDGLTIEGGSDPICQYDLAGDENNDCKVDFSDYALLANQETDFGALATMAANWLIDCNAKPLDSACI